MAKGSYNRSAVTGRYVSRAAAARHPRTTVTESASGRGGGGTAYRSAISGRYVTGATAARRPRTTVKENG